MAKKKKMKHIRKGNFGAIETRNNVYTYEIDGAIERTSTIENNPFSYVDRAYHVGGFKIIGRGIDNNMPIEIRKLLEENHIAPGVLRQQLFLLIGNGPVLYRNSFKDGQYIREYVEDKQVSDWLKSWNYEEYLNRIAVDYFATHGSFTNFIRNRGGRIGNGFINRLEHIGVERAALEYPDDNGVIQHIIVGNWQKLYSRKLYSYPVWDKNKPFKSAQAISYNHFYSFARRYYSVSGFQGAINWIKRSSDIPKVLESLTNNSLNIKWHIRTPLSYWEHKKEKLEEQAALKGQQFTNSMLEKVKDEMFMNLSEMLSGVENVGKFFESEAITNEYGKLEGWEIIPIDMKVKDFIVAQLEISKHSDLTVASGLGLSPSLSNLVINGSLSSGSDKLYSLKLHLATNTHIPERIITEAINNAIDVNFPKSNVKLGFYREVVQVEESLNPEDRLKNEI